MSFLTNWKTTGSGIVMIVLGIAGLLGIKGGTDPSIAITSIMGGIGLIFAKDNNVTGGTTPQ